MNLKTYFDDFLTDISLSDAQRGAFVAGHQTLRRRLELDPQLSPLIVATFLQGSMRRNTAVRPEGGRRPDADLVVVTRLDGAGTPAQAMALFQRFLREHYPGQWETQGRSLGLHDDQHGVAVDLVLTASQLVGGARTLPDGGFALNGEGAEQGWLHGPLLIPDPEAEAWVSAHPRAQAEYARERNRQTNGNYAPLVRAFKWWKQQHPSMPRHPKSYPLERLVGECCPAGVGDLAEAFVRTLGAMVERYGATAAQEWVPFLGNPGLPQVNVLGRLAAKDFALFMERVEQAYQQARAALDEGDKARSIDGWLRLFGQAFPTRAAAAVPTLGGRFA